jgi:HD-GYP domain-containing protein (c-di-GMP phosphodiesterase class II)
MKLSEAKLKQIFKVLTDIGISLSTEKNHSLLLEMILLKAKQLTNADGGTIYTCTDDNNLKFEIMHTDSLKLHLGGSSGNEISFPDLPLYNKFGKPNNTMLAPWVALNRKTINIKDAYSIKKFDLSGTKKFDLKTGYHSQSFLVVPLTNHLNEVIGVLQLINAVDKKSKKIIPFSPLNKLLTESLASQAAMIITNRQLIAAQKDLFDALIQLIAKSIDEKSPYTGGHCRRVPVITRMLADAACRIDNGPLKNFKMTEDELYELEVAAWLHDCGKIITPEAVVDKSSKLEKIFDTIHLIDTRFEVLKRDLIINTLQNKLHELTGAALDLNSTELQQELAQLNLDRDMIREFNIGGEELSPNQFNAIEHIAQRTWTTPDNTVEHLLSPLEIQLLKIPKGTLSQQEREIINNHVSVTIKMLESLPYPKNLRNVPELAGSHHEKIDGTGYPRGLTKEQMSIPARMIAIADIFEALTASDRPYKKAMPLSQALNIMAEMKLNGHIDPDLFDVFMEAKIYDQYAMKYLEKNSIGS